MTPLGPTTFPNSVADSRKTSSVTPAPSTAWLANRLPDVTTDCPTQLESITAAGRTDMLLAARLEDALNREQALAKLLEAGPKAAKDLLV
ncbi:hypothetical protein PI87_24090 [Ralstonia sp. A12]|uniref:hypothetical protein n=1 Tax=Ralstonia sp. A12 TaxID=1217052 RepID=UPI000574ECA7|nr:hypothetical protein [Ralstonia sp. A12]KHK49839.1 hypothetical protein PI87_24090 [Ralstonia sp. A12]